MSFVKDFKDIISINIKTRYDSLFDHYSRILMPKILLMSSIIIGLNWFTDDVTCQLPSYVKFSSTFVSETCWINGFYIYKPLANSSSPEAGYYGIPLDTGFDGMYKNGRLCTTVTKYFKLDKDCAKMEKTFFLQYQWFPFFLSSLMLVFYAPYLLYKWNNEDLISLSKCCHKSQAEEIIQTYFTKQGHQPMKKWSTIFINVFIKLLYVLCHVIVFVLINVSFNYEFKTYGIKWMKWSAKHEKQNKDPHYGSYYRRPGETILPSFGLCEIQEAATDKRYAVSNTHQFICEYSAHVLYHYVLLTLWFFSVIGMIISFIGFVFHLVQPFVRWMALRTSPYHTKLLSILNLREFEYLSYIKRHNHVLYRSIVENLVEENYPLKKNRITFQSLRESLHDISSKLEMLEREKHMSMRSTEML